MPDPVAWVWVPDPKTLFTKAQVVTDDVEGKLQVRIADTGELKTVDASDVEKVNPAQFNQVGDMAELTYLNEPSVVHNLSTRWHAGKIYTYSGLFLVAVNPYRSLPIYEPSAVAEYKGKRRADTEAHIYAVAENAFRNMLETKRDQSILITGESGAGKTENTKKAIQYLSSVTNSGEGGIDERILQTNPILEAFGNAQTIRNANSSRFGKFIKIEFSHAGRGISGASIQWYLLEKSRVVTQHVNERNYHVFYQLLAGAPKELKKKLLIEDDATPKSFTYLASGASEIDGVDDALMYGKLVDAFKIMGFKSVDLERIMGIVASVLLLGQIKFKAASADQGSFVDSSHLERVATLLGVGTEDLADAILRPRVKVGREVTRQSRTAAQALHSTSAMAKALYERLFGYIVSQLNRKLGSKEGVSSCIGVLDIAGFEIFKENSFEQLCINYTNEKLQQFFNHHMFVLEQEEYARENVDWEYVDYGSDLQPTIDLIEKSKNPMGIFSVLNEESVLPSGSDGSFHGKLIKQWSNENSKFSPSRLGSGFKISHYAQEVEYQTDGWIEKNKDPLSDAVVDLLGHSSNPLVSVLFDAQVHNSESSPAKGKSSMFRTVAQRHKEQLSDLMSHLDMTEPHFVRCIIPNTHRSPSEFDNSLVLNQLRYNGVLEGIRIARTGFPNRLDFAEFSKRYRPLAGSVSGPVDSQQTAATILHRLDIDQSQYKVGLSKVFFRNGVLAGLEHRLDTLVKTQTIAVQALSRAALIRNEVGRALHRRRAAKLLAACFRTNERVAKDPWWQVTASFKPLLLSKENMDNNRKDMRMQKLEASLHRLKEEQVELISSKNELRGELIAALKSREELETALEERNKALVEREEAHTLAMNSAKSRDEASTAALKELSEKHRALRDKYDTEEEARRRLKEKTEAEHTAKLDELSALLASTKADLEKSMSKVSRLEGNVSELASVKESLKTATRQLSEEKSANAALKSAKNELTESHQDLQKKHDLASQQVEAHSNQLAEKEESLITANSELSKLRKWLSKAKEELTDSLQLRKDFADIDSKLKTATEDLMQKDSDLKSEKEQHEKLAKMLRAANERLDTSVAADKLELANKESEVLRRELASSKYSLQKAEKDLMSMKLRYEEAQRDLKAAQADLTKLASDHRVTKDSLADSETRLATIKSKLTKAENDLTSSEESRLEISASLKDTQRLSKEQENQLMALRDTLKNTEASLAEAEQISKANASAAEELPELRVRYESTVAELRESHEKLSELNDLLSSPSRGLPDTAASNLADYNKMAELRKKLADTQKALVRAQTQNAAPSTMSPLNGKGRFGRGDLEQQLSESKYEAAQAESRVQELEQDLEKARKELGQYMILRRKYEKLQREKAAIVQDRSHLMLGMKQQQGHSRGIEISQAQAAETKKVQSELNVVKLQLARSEKRNKELENKLSEVSRKTELSGSSATPTDMIALKQRLRLAEIAKLQLEKAVAELSRNPPSAAARPNMRSLAETGEPLDPNDPPLVVHKRDIPRALRVISNDRRVSEQKHQAADKIKYVDLEEALEMYKRRSNELHAKLEKAELVVTAAMRAEGSAKEQLESLRARQDRLDDDHKVEVSELRRSLMEARKDSSSKEIELADLRSRTAGLAELEHRLKEASRTVKELADERDRYASEKAKLERRWHELVSSVDERPRRLQEQLAVFKQNEQVLLQKQNALEWKLDRKERLVDQLRSSLHDSDVKLEHYRSEIDKLQADDSAKSVALRRASRDAASVREQYLMAERELEQYRSSYSRRSSPRTTDDRPAFI